MLALKTRGVIFGSHVFIAVEASVKHATTACIARQMKQTCRPSVYGELSDRRMGEGLSRAADIFIPAVVSAATDQSTTAQLRASAAIVPPAHRLLPEDLRYTSNATSYI